MTEQQHDDQRQGEQRRAQQGSDTAMGAEETIGATGATGDDPSLEKDPEDWVSGDDPMTTSQKSYLDTLARQAGETLPADLTKAQASEHIERLRDPQQG